MFDKIKTNAKKGVEKIKTVAVNNKDKLVKGAAIIGSGALAVGAIGFIKNRFGGDDYVTIDEIREKGLYLQDPETGEMYYFTPEEVEENIDEYSYEVEDSKDKETEETE